LSLTNNNQLNAKNFTIHENDSSTKNNSPAPPQGKSKPSNLKNRNVYDPSTSTSVNASASKNTNTSNVNTTVSSNVTPITNTKNGSTTADNNNINAAATDVTASTNAINNDIDQDVAEFLLNQEKAAKNIGRRIALVSSLIETLNYAKIKVPKANDHTLDNAKEYHSHTMTKTKVYVRSPFGTINANDNLSSIDSHSNPNPFRVREFKTASNIEKDLNQKNEQVLILKLLLLLLILILIL